MKLEYRQIPVGDVEIRSEEDGKLTLSGYAAVFNRNSEDLGGFIEILRPGCFRKTLESNPDVRALFNHDASTIFARTKNGSLVLEENQTGLKFAASIDMEDEDGKRIYQKVKSGLIDQCSFAFSVSEEGQKWSEKNSGPALREILEVNYLGDVSVVAYPAYPQTSVQARSALEEAGFNYEALASLITRAQRGLPLTDSDRDLIDASIMVLQDLLPEDKRDGGDAGTRESGDAARLQNVLTELELLEIKNKRKGDDK